MQFLNQIVNGIGIGSIYALVALGYTMVYGIVKLINFAHGDIIMAGSYIVLFLMMNMNVPFGVAVFCSMIFCAAMGVIMERIAYKPLRNAPRISALITAIGVSIFIQNAFMLIFGANPKAFPSIMVGTVKYGSYQVGVITLVTIATSLVLMIALNIFIKKTKIGKAMRAVSEDAGAASLMGINVNTTISITFAIGSALATIGGALYSVAYPLLQPTMGSVFGLKAFVAAVFGGIGIIPGAMFGGFAMGVVESITKSVNSRFSDSIVFGILIIILLVKPSGVFGKNIKEKV